MTGGTAATVVARGFGAGGAVSPCPGGVQTRWSARSGSPAGAASGRSALPPAAGESPGSHAGTPGLPWSAPTGASDVVSATVGAEGAGAVRSLAVGALRVGTAAQPALARRPAARPIRTRERGTARARSADRDAIGRRSLPQRATPLQTDDDSLRASDSGRLPSRSSQRGPGSPDADADRATVSPPRRRNPGIRGSDSRTGEANLFIARRRCVECGWTATSGDRLKSDSMGWSSRLGRFTFQFAIETPCRSDLPTRHRQAVPCSARISAVGTR